jgi:flagellar FliJ protein
MKKFKFKLEGVLKLRRMAERQALMELAAVQSQINSIANRINRMKEEMEQSRQRFMQQSKDDFKIASVRMFDEFVVRIQQDEQYLEAKKEEMRPLLEGAQQKYRDAHRDRKVMENLREAEYSKYRYMVKKQRQKEADEINRRLLEDTGGHRDWSRKAMQSEIEEREVQREQVLIDAAEQHDASSRDAFSGFRNK